MALALRSEIGGLAATRRLDGPDFSIAGGGFAPALARRHAVALSATAQDSLVWRREFWRLTRRESQLWKLARKKSKLWKCAGKKSKL